MNTLKEKIEAMQRELERLNQPTIQERHQSELKTFDTSELLKWDNKTLAKWQSRFEPDEPQWVLADQEWKRRTGISTRRIAISAIVISMLSLLVAALTYLHLLNVSSRGSETQLVPPTKQSK